MDPNLDALLAETGWLNRLARSMAGDAQRAEDAVQETFVAALERRGETRRSPRGWLRAVLRSKLVQSERERDRRARRERQRPSDSTTGGTGDVHERLERHEIVARAVRELEEPYRAAIVARYFDELAPAAIAARDGVPVRTVHTRLERGLSKLRARLSARLGEDRMNAWLGLLAGPAVRWGGAGVTGAGGFVMSTGVKLGLGAAGLAGLLWLGRAWLEPEKGRVLTGATQGRAMAPVSGPSIDDEGQVASYDLQEPAPGSEVPFERERQLLSTSGKEPAPLASTARGTGFLHVRVRRQSDSALLGGVDIEVTSRASERSAARTEARATTSAEGTFVLRVPAGRALAISFEARKDPENPLQPCTLEIEALEPGESRPLEIRLPGGLDRRFHGLVVAAEDGRPLGDAELTRIPARGPAPAVDAGGAFVLSYVSWAPDELEVRCAGRAPVRFDLGRVPQEPSAPFVVRLERAAAVDARVVAGGDRGTLELVLQAPQGREWRQRLDGQGCASVEELPVQSALAIELHCEGRPIWRDPERWTLAPGERRVLDLSLENGCLLFGTLFDEAGRVVRDQGVVALAASAREGFEAGGFRALQADESAGAVQATLDGQGGFEFSALPEGQWWIGPRAGEGQLAPWAVGVEVHPGSHAKRLDLHGERGRWIRGLVLGPDGEPLRPCRVMAQRGEDRGRTTASSSDGRFELGPLAQGEYDLRAFSEGTFGWGEPTRASAGDEDVRVHVGRTHTIGGRVVDEAGRGVRAHVHLLKRNSSLGTSTADEGTFLFTGLDPGPYCVSATLPDGRTAVVAAVLREGERVEGLVLALSPGARLAIRHGLTETARVSIWSGELLVDDFTVRPGGEAFSVAPAGPIRVELYGGGRTLAERSLIGRADHVETIELEPR